MMTYPMACRELGIRFVKALAFAIKAGRLGCSWAPSAGFDDGADSSKERDLDPVEGAVSVYGSLVDIFPQRRAGSKTDELSRGVGR